MNQVRGSTRLPRVRSTNCSSPRSWLARRWSSSPTTSRAPAGWRTEIALLHEGRIAAQGTAADMDASEHPIVREFMRSEGGG